MGIGRDEPGPPETADGAVRIVVGVDFRPGGDRALQQALRTAQQVRDAEVHVVHAAATPAEDDHQALQESLVQLPERLWQRVENLAGDCVSAGRVRVVSHVRRGPPERALAGLARQFEADWIFLGTEADAAASRPPDLARALRAPQGCRLLLVGTRALRVLPSESREPPPADRSVLYSGTRAVPRTPQDGGPS